MGFFHVENKKADKHLKGLSPDFLRKHGCQVCPLNSTDIVTPKMEASGSEQPEILIIGTAPTKADDERGEHFAGKYGDLIKERISDAYNDVIRWTNAVHCHPKARTPESVEMSCCKPRIEADVAKTKPKAIFGFGATALYQIVNPDSKYRQMSLWRGRRVLVEVGGYPCWYFPIQHPLEILKSRKFEPRNLNSYGSEDEFAFAFDLRRAFGSIDALPKPDIHTADQASSGIETITDDINRVAELLEEAGAQLYAGVDIETNCLRPYDKGAKILTMSVSTKKGTFAFCVDHSQSSWIDLERRQLGVLIKRFLYETKCRKIVHHLPFELEWFGYFFGTGCFYASVWECSESQAYVLDARRGGLSLDFLCLVYFGLRLKEISSLDRKNLDRSPLNSVLKYNGIDARYHRLLFFAQLPIVRNEEMEDVYDFQLRRIPALVLATLQGVPVDQAEVKKYKKKYTDIATKVAAKIAMDPDVKEFERIKGREFNPSSVPDVNFLVRDILGETTESSSKGELENIDAPIARLIVQWREPNKVLSTYILPVDETNDDSVLYPDGMMHPIISTTTVISWRTSSEGPNIQNWTKRDEERKEVRSQVKHKDRKMRIVSFDYAGIQARNVAMESKDKQLVESYWHNYDIHTTWMENINKHFPKWIPKSNQGYENEAKKLKAYRHLAKNKFVFPSFFGAQSYSISESLGIPKNIIEGVQEEFFDQFRDIAKWHKQLEKFYYKNGYVTGLSGFRRYAPVSPNERINTPIQSDESIIVMDAMSRLAELEDPRYQAMLMVHDDLTFCWPYDEIEKRAEVVIKELITLPFEWTKIVPIEVEMSVGEDWIHMDEVGKYANDKWDGIVQMPKK